MIIELAWYYEIQPEAKLAHDKDGNDTATYIRYAINFKEAIDDPKTEYWEQAKTMANEVATQLKIPVEYIKPISKKEYDEMFKDEDNEQQYEEEFVFRDYGYPLSDEEE